MRSTAEAPPAAPAIARPLAVCAPAHRRAGTPGAQSGASLMVVLMMLAIVSLLGLSAVQLAILGERGARNDRDYQIAWQAAEAALADAESDIEGRTEAGAAASARAEVFDGTGNGHFAPGCGTSGPARGLCQPATSGAPVWQVVDLAGDASPAVPLGTFTGRTFPHGPGLRPARQPRYIVEAVTDYGVGTAGSHDDKAYRITAIGFGPRDSTQVVLQAVYRK